MELENFEKATEIKTQIDGLVHLKRYMEKTFEKSPFSFKVEFQSFGRSQTDMLDVNVITLKSDISEKAQKAIFNTIDKEIAELTEEIKML